MAHGRGHARPDERHGLSSGHRSFCWFVWCHRSSQALSASSSPTLNDFGFSSFLVSFLSPPPDPSLRPVCHGIYFPLGISKWDFRIRATGGEAGDRSPWVPVQCPTSFCGDLRPTSTRMSTDVRFL